MLNDIYDLKYLNTAEPKTKHMTWFYKSGIQYIIAILIIIKK